MPSLSLFSLTRRTEHRRPRWRSRPCVRPSGARGNKGDRLVEGGSAQPRRHADKMRGGGHASHLPSLSLSLLPISERRSTPRCHADEKEREVARMHLMHSLSPSRCPTCRDCPSLPLVVVRTSCHSSERCRACKSPLFYKKEGGYGRLDLVLISEFSFNPLIQ